MKNKTIIIVLNNHAISGAEKRLCRIMRSLVLDYNFNIILVIGTQLYKDISESTEEISEITRLVKKTHIIKDGFRLNSLRLFNWYTNVLKVLRPYDKTIPIHFVLDLNSPILASFFLPGRKIIFEVTSPRIVDQMSGAKRRFYSKKLVFNYVSQTVRDRHVKKAGIKNNFQVAPIPYYQNKNDDVDINTKENLVVFGSRFIERKNPILFATVIKKILAKYPNWRAEMLGGGELEPEVRQILAEEIKNNRIVVGSVPNLYSVLLKSRIYVSLIIPDNFPSQSLMEAMEAKNAIVATNVGLTPTLVSNNGILVNKDEEELFNALEYLVQHEEELNDMCINSRVKLMNEFSSDVYLRHFIKLYN